MTPSNASPGGGQIGGQIGGLIRLMRPKQWVKNAFVLAPLIFARAFNDPTAVTEALIAVALFCAASSASTRRLVIISSWARRSPTSRLRR